MRTYRATRCPECGKKIRPTYQGCLHGQRCAHCDGTYIPPNRITLQDIEAALAESDQDNKDLLSFLRAGNIETIRNRHA